MPSNKPMTIGELRMEARPKDQMFKAVIYPDKQMIGCVIQQAIVGGDSSLCQLFDTACWEVGSMDGAKPVSGTLEDWKKLATKWNALKSKEA